MTRPGPARSPIGRGKERKREGGTSEYGMAKLINPRGILSHKNKSNQKREKGISTNPSIKPKKARGVGESVIVKKGPEMRVG